MLPDKTSLVFGALLHDIGKIVYRGNSAKGTHSELGAAFISEEVAVLNSGFDGETGSRIVEQIRYHHANEMSGSTALAADSLAWITYFADNISAGMDRKSEGDEAQKAFFDKTVKLRKIFNILNERKDDNTLEHDDYNSIRERIKNGLAGIEVSLRGVNSLLNLLEATTSSVPSSTNMTELVDVSLFDHVKTTAGIAACIYECFIEQKVTDYKQALFKSGV
jgi:CRISPR-associated protein Csm1